jgi:alcohol dehydrogenase class IV
MEVNVAAIRERLPASEALRRYEEIAQTLTGSETAKASDGVEWVKELCRTLRIPSLSAYGVRSSDFPELIERADRASSMKGNPIRLTKDEMLQMLSRAL